VGKKIMKRLLFLLVLILSTPLTYAQTVTLNEGTIVNSSPSRVGLNIGNAAYYDNSQIYNNRLAYNNPGMEPVYTSQIQSLNINGNTTTWTEGPENAIYDGVPTNYFAGGTFTIVSGPYANLTSCSVNGSNVVTVSGASGTVPSVNFIVGDIVKFSGFTGGCSFLNTAGNLTVASESTTSMTLTGLTHASLSTQTDSGTAQHPEAGATGTISSNTSSSGSTAAPTYTVSSAIPAPGFQIGDVIVLSVLTKPTPESWWESGAGGLANTSVGGGGQILSDTTDLCATCGTQAVEFNLPSSGATTSAQSAWDTSGFDVFDILNGSYTFSYWAKLASGSATLTISCSRSATGGFATGNFSDTLTSTWTKYTHTFTLSESQSSTSTGNAACYFNASTSSSGAIYMDNISFAPTSPSQSTVLKDAYFNQLKTYFNTAANPSTQATLRYWIDQNGETLTNWTNPDYARNVTSPYYEAAPAASASLTLGLEPYLIICNQLGVNPYLEVPITFSNSDAQNIIEFMAATSGTWYTQRVSAGLAAGLPAGNGPGQAGYPWTSAFSTIYLSFANEAWNTATLLQILPDRPNQPNSEFYMDYSTRAKTIFSQMRSAADFSSVFQLGLDAQTATTYTADIATARSHPDYIEVENYLYGQVGTYTPDSSLWGPAYVEPYQMMTDSSDPSNFYGSWSLYGSLNTCGTSGTNTCYTTIYEAGQGTTGGGITQQYVDYINAGGGQAAITGLQFPLHEQIQPAQFKAQNFFASAEFQQGFYPGFVTKLWGNFIDAGGATNNVRPTFLGPELSNLAIIGSMYSCPVTGSGSTYNFAGSSKNGTTGALPAQNNIPYVYAFCYKNGSNRAIEIVNADISNPHTITWAGSTTPNGLSVTQTQVAPPALDDLNEAASSALPTNHTAATVTISTTSITGGPTITVPAASVTVLQFSTGGTPTANTPTFSPVAGSYGPSQSVTISTTSSGAIICYSTSITPSTNGGTGCSSGTLYTTPVTIASSSTLQAVAGGAGYTDSTVGSATYTINGAASTPTFSPTAGSYAGTQSVTISTSTGGATLCYTTDGSTPTATTAGTCSHGTTYSGAVSVSTSQTLMAIATESGWTNSSVGSASYVINGTLATPTFSPTAGTYPSAQSVTITIPAGSTGCYTIDGSTPLAATAGTCSNGTTYSGPVTISSSLTIKAIATEVAFTNSAVGSASYTISPPTTNMTINGNVSISGNVVIQ
jgi:hypothetical protein